MKLCFQNDLLEAGCDEAGRGCLAGPVFAAAVILPKNFEPEFLTDSKKLTEAKRNYLRNKIENEATAYAVASVSPSEIDEMNILNASFLAMHRALDKLTTLPQHIAVDGNRFTPYNNISYNCCIKGDANYLNIAAASILAKTYRDEYMLQLHQKFPQFHWNTNKGYPTKAHREGIKKYGATQHHRRSFTLLPPQIEIDFP